MGKMVHKIDRRVSAASAVLCGGGGEETEPEGKALIHWLICDRQRLKENVLSVPTVTAMLS